MLCISILVCGIVRYKFSFTRLLATGLLLEFNRRTAVDVVIVAIFLARWRGSSSPWFVLLNGLELVTEIAMF